MYFGNGSFKQPRIPRYSGMTRITAWIEAFALSDRRLGIFVIAFLDSSFLSFPEVNDFLIILMVVRHPERMLFYATMATLGSVAGCLALYFVARKGGEAMVRKRFHPRARIGRMALDAKARRHGVARSRAAAAAGAVQDLRADGRRGGDSAAHVHPGHSGGPRRPILRGGNSRPSVGRGGPQLRPRERRARSAWALGCLPSWAGAGYLWWKKKRTVNDLYNIDFNDS